MYCLKGVCNFKYSELFFFFAILFKESRLNLNILIVSNKPYLAQGSRPMCWLTLDGKSDLEIKWKIICKNNLMQIC